MAEDKRPANSWIDVQEDGEYEDEVGGRNQSSPAISPEREQGAHKDEKEAKGAKRLFLGEPVTTLKREIHFTVEAPNGDQIPMRYKPEMTVETVFLIACKKFRISPSEHYSVLNNKELSRTDRLKECSINQNSIFRIYKGKLQAVVPDIFVSIKIRDCRIGSVFLMTDNIWTILNQLLSVSSFEPEMVPVVIYVRTELIGEEALRGARLRDMGITTGSCELRFLQLKQEDLDMRKMRDESDDAITLETLELRAAGPMADAGLRSVHFKLSEDELDTENVQYIGERKAVAFRILDAETVEEAIQEEFFDLLIGEITAVFNELSSKLKNVMEKSEIIADVRRELEKLKEIRTDFEETVVRVIFPDKYCLQFIFLSEERIVDVKDFTSKFLRDPSENFELTLGPPNNVTVEDSMTLGDLKMVPIARLFYHPISEGGLPIVEDQHRQYLSDEVVQNLVTYTLGKDAATMLRGESLEKFLVSDERDDSRGSSIRKSGFISRFLRGSTTSSRTVVSSTNSRFSGSRSRSIWMKKPSSFQPRSVSRASARSGGSDDDDEDVTGWGPKSSFARSKSVFQWNEDSKNSLLKQSNSSQAKLSGSNFK